MKYAAIYAAALALGMAFQPSAMAQNLSTEESVAALQSYIIRFAEPGLLYNTGQQRGYAATAPQALGQRKLDANTPDALSYRQLLKSQQDAYVQAINTKIARTVKVSHNYDVTMSGIAALLHPSEVAAIRSINGVASVELAGEFYLNTDAGPNWIGAPSVWAGTSTPNNVPTRGQGVVVGVFDSGVNMDHPSFGNDASCGFSAANPKLVAAKDCEQANCVGGNPEDNGAGSVGHGVHTASTAAGNALTPPLNVGGVELRWPISGVAPCAKVITYKVCPATTCPGAAIAAAIQASIVDQVDVVNFSISGGTNPWSDNDRGFLDMVNADILVAASAGNTRAAPNDIAIGAVNHRGPWVLTVANSTHDRVEGNSISLAGSLQNQVGSPAATPVLSATLNTQFVSGISVGNQFGCTDTGGFPAGSMTGKVALIQRGPLNGATPACAFTEKMQNAQNAGAVAAIIYDHSPGPLINMTPGVIPAFFVFKSVGETWAAALASNPTAQGTIVAPAQRLIDPLFGDILNAGSLRGPNIIGTTTVGTNTYLGSDTTKPDITGPGTNIYAAVGDQNGQFGFLTGTSMSSPHLAGSAALIRAANPTWTPMEVMSAIMLTAKPNGLIQDAVTPWGQDDVGSGRVDLTRAATAGLVMNESFANFVAANPSVTGNQEAVRALNRASYRNTQCPGGVCVFTRTFRNTRNFANSWNVITTGAPAGTTITAVPNVLNFTGSLSETATVTFTVRITQAGGIVPGPVPRPNFGVISLVTAAPVGPANPDVFLRYGFEDPATLPPLRFTVGIAGPQAP